MKAVSAIVTFLVMVAMKWAILAWYFTLAFGIIHLHGFPNVPALGWKDSMWIAAATVLVQTALVFSYSPSGKSDSR